MTESLRVLILEDNPADAELVQFELQEAGIVFTPKVVMTEEDFVRAIQEFSPDLILSDYDLPKYNGALALAEAKRRCPETPFILVTGAVTEDRAIDILTQGARDYVLKNRLNQRLAPAVKRALTEAGDHRARKQAEVELREAHRTLEERVKVRTAELEAEIEIRKQAEEMVQQQVSLLDLSYDAIFIWDLNGAIKYWNQGAEKLYGYSRDEAVGRVSHELLGTRHPMSMNELMASLEKNGTWDGELSHMTKDGRRIVVDSRHQLMRRDGCFIILETNRDITGRKKMDELLQDSEKRYRRLFESAKDGILILDAYTGKVEDVNPFLLQLLGYSHDALRGKYIWELGVFKDIVASKDAFKALQENEYIRYDDLPLETRNGQSIAVEFVSNVYLVDHHKVVQCNIRDITERKRAEAAMQEIQTKLKAAFASMTEAIFIADADGCLIDFNEGFVRYHRFKDRAECSKTIADCPRYLEAYFQDGTPAPLEMWAMPRALRGETASDVEYMLRRKDSGETWWGTYNFSPIKDNDGRIIGAVVAARDITDRKQAEEALREGEVRFRVLAETSPVALSVTSLAGKFLYVNAVYESLFGYTSNELKTIPGTHVYWDVNDRKELLKAMKETGCFRNFELRLKGKNGELFWGLASASSIIFDGEQAVLGAITDITPLKKAEELLRTSKEELERQTAKLKVTLDAAPAITWTAHDRDCRSITGNRAAHEFSRVQEGVDLSKTGSKPELLADYRIFHGGVELQPQDMPIQVVARTGQELQGYTLDFLFDDGSIRSLIGNVVPVLDASRCPTGAIAAFMDITEHKRTEEEIRAANQELEEFNQAMVGRELRMIELKQEINAVCAQLGQPPRYPLEDKEAPR